MNIFNHSIDSGDRIAVAERIEAYMRKNLDAMIEALGVYVNHDSPSRDKTLLDALSGEIETRMKAAGGRVERIENAQGGDHLLIRFGPETTADDSKPILILGHFDTVWPAGTALERPFRIESGRGFGPGSYDMKASVVLIEFAVAAIRDLELGLDRRVTLLLNSDEEIGSPTSRRRIEREARESAFALVVEPPTADGSLKTARKGVGRFRIETHGKAAHAGVEPEKGVNAIVELAHQIVNIPLFQDLSRGTTLNVGLIEGGSGVNVVAARASAEIDARVSNAAEADRIERAFAALKPALDGTNVVVSGGFNRPPMERSDAIAGLFERARSIAKSLDLDLTEASTGGGSDANFTAPFIPTLDGLGVPGAGAHAENEHVIVSEIPRRAALFALLLLYL
jgi:glutamate carboxypeptidase